MLFRELYAGFLFFVESKRKRNRELCSLPRCISIAETGILIEKDGCSLLKKRGIILENRAGGYNWYNQLLGLAQYKHFHFLYYDTLN